MKKKSLSVKKKNHNNFILDKLKFSKIKHLYKQFESTLDNYLNDKSIAIGVSGGPDSLSLCYFAKCYALKNKIKVYLYIVDHKIRKNSTSEALKVKSILRPLKSKCKILVWRGKKPKNNLQSVARKKRYFLLKKQCKKDNVKTILLGHHLEDLYENFFIRLSRGSGLNGLLSFYEIEKIANGNIKILRPLINNNKKDLIYTAKKVFNFYVNDPSNHNEQFKRIRFRKLINSIKNEGFDENKFKLTLKNLKESNISINFYVKRNILLNSTYLKKNSFYLLNSSFFNEANEVVFRSFALILNKIGKRYYNARGKSISLILNKIRGKNFVKSTLSGCIIEKVGNSIKISKENNEKL